MLLCVPSYVLGVAASSSQVCVIPNFNFHLFISTYLLWSAFLSEQLQLDAIFPKNLLSVDDNSRKPDHNKCSKFRHFHPPKSQHGLGFMCSKHIA